MLQIRSPIYMKTIYISNKTLNKKTKHNEYLAQMSAIYCILIESINENLYQTYGEEAGCCIIFSLRWGQSGVFWLEIFIMFIRSLVLFSGPYHPSLMT